MTPAPMANSGVWGKAPRFFYELSVYIIWVRACSTVQYEVPKEGGYGRMLVLNRLDG